MESDLFTDLKQLDKRLQDVEKLLGFCVELFDAHYSPRNHCWPYRVEGRPPKEKWGHYPHLFPRMSRLSPITSAMCAWPISKYLLSKSNGRDRLGEIPQKVARTLATVPLSKLQSKTFTGRSEVFVRTEVLRFLASQAQWKPALFTKLFRRVENDIAEGISKGREAGEKEGGEPQALHSFFLHYYVLAIEQVRDPIVRFANSVSEICRHAKKLEDSKAKSWTTTVNLLRLVRELHESIDSLAVQANSSLLRPSLAKRFRTYADGMRGPIKDLSTAIREDNRKSSKKALSSIKRTLRSCRGEIHKSFANLPLGIARIGKTADSWKAISSVVLKIKQKSWYRNDFADRLREDVLSQISYASCADFSRLDIGRMAYSLAAALRCGAIEVGGPVTKRALSIIFEHQHGGRWTQIQPIWATKQGSVHLPLNMEIANALLPVLSNCLDAGTWTSWIEIDQIMDWVCSTINRLGDESGWSTEHDYAPDRIDLYVTAQVVQFLSDYGELRRRLVVRSALERAGLTPLSSGSVGTKWRDLKATDLEQEYEAQVTIKLRNSFVEPLQRTGKLASSSVLLYGPPGTSKTSIMEALANKLCWNFLAISPADLLATGGEQVEARSTLIFEILNRAKAIVVLFDEVDELLLDREAKVRPEGIFRFMTTSMLPKLQVLRNRRNVIFGIATNYVERLDKAITRLGRVDHEWAVLPPDLTSKMVLTKEFLEETRRPITCKSARAIAANTPFFSYLELRRLVCGEKKTRSELKKIHPTARLDAYLNRPDSDKEVRALLVSQIGELFLQFAQSKTKNRLFRQLKEMKEKKRDGTDEELFEKDTIKVIAETMQKLRASIH